MPTHPSNPDATLQTAIAQGRAVVVAGTGVSMSASLDVSTGKSHPQASWAGLLENGLEWLKQHHFMGPEEADAHLTLLKKCGNIHHFVSAAADVTRLMGGVGSNHFEDWIKKTIGTIKAHDRKTLDALEALRRNGNLLATTNYDGLLLDDAGTLKPVTWKDHDAFLRAARNKETEKVIFLHGYWKQPTTVILDWTSYQEIARDERYREDLATVWNMTTWLYVGCGFNGLNDPDFGLLLERYGKRARNADLWDFCLVRHDQRDQFQAHFDKLQFNICAVSFGDSHDKLPDYLRALLPSAAPAEPSMAAVVRPLPLVEPVTEFLRVTDNFFQYRAPGGSASGITFENRGVFRFTAEEFRFDTVHRAKVVDQALNRLCRDGCVWLEGPSAGGKTTVYLHLIAEWDCRGCKPLYLDLSDEPNAELAVREIAAQAKPGQIFILDNIHSAPKVACALIDQWKSQRCDSVMILSGWPAAVTPERDYLSGHRSAIVSVSVQPDDWIGVYQSTFRLIQGIGCVPPKPSARIVKEWDNNFAADLVTFQYALAAGLAKGNPFQIEHEAADIYVREKYLDPCTDEERRDLFALACFADLGVGLGAEALRSRFTHSLSCGLVRWTLHGRFKKHRRFHPWHRSFGRLLLSSLSPSSLQREQVFCESVVSHPYCSEILSVLLANQGETTLAMKIVEHALHAQPCLSDWFGDNLLIGTRVLRHMLELVPARWNEIIVRLIEPQALERLQAQAFATPLGDLASFLQFCGKTRGLESVQEALIRAMVADAKLPDGQSRLIAQAFVTPLHFLVKLLGFSGETSSLKPVRNALIRAMVADAELPDGQSRLQTQVFTTPLGQLATFLQFILNAENLKTVQEALIRAMVADAELPDGQSRLIAQAFATPLHFLVSFLQLCGQTKSLGRVQGALIRAMIVDAELPDGQSRLIAQAFATPLHFLVSFLEFSGESSGLKSVRNALIRAMVADAELPDGQSRLIAQAFATPLHFLVSFLQFSEKPSSLKSVRNALIRAMVADSRQPSEKSRLLEHTFVTPLSLLATFLQFTIDTKELAPVLKSFVRVLSADAKRPTNQSRLLTEAFIAPLSDLICFIEFAGQTMGLEPVQDALIGAMVVDAMLPADKSRLLRTARKTKRENLRGFLNGLQGIPDTEPLAKIVKSDPDCCKVLRELVQPHSPNRSSKHGRGDKK